VLDTKLGSRPKEWTYGRGSRTQNAATAADFCNGSSSTKSSNSAYELMSASTPKATKIARRRKQHVTMGHEPFHDKNVRHHAASSSSRAFACFRSNVSKPSVNQP
jgi:hypothetical protein